MKKYLVEFIGTFFFIFTIGCVVLNGAQNIIPAIAIGFALMIMVYAGGHISGGHYNPAVSLSAAIRGALPYKELLPYICSQIAGGAVAISIAYFVMTPYYLSPAEGFNILSLVISEFLFTFALCYVVLLTATDKTVKGNSYYGLAIGSTIVVAIFAANKFCLTAFNPAIAVAFGIIKLASWKIVAITIFANLLAAISAAGIYKLVAQKD